MALFFNASQILAPDYVLSGDVLDSRAESRADCGFGNANRSRISQRPRARPIQSLIV